VERPAIQPEALEKLSRHPWLGNVRELENTTRKALLLARGYPIGSAEIERTLSGARATTTFPSPAIAEYVAQLLAEAERGEVVAVRDVATEILERELFAQAIKLAHGNQTKAARWLGVSRITMREKLAQFGLNPREA